MAGIGDVDGDGYPDLAVGAPESEFVGRVLVFAGSALGIVATPARVIRSPGGMPGRFGAAVAAAGDFDGDGYADLVAGSPSLSGFLGGIHLFLGSATGVPVTPAATWMGSLGVGSLFGGSLASGRDILQGIARYVRENGPWLLYHQVRSLEDKPIPASFDFNTIPSLRREARQKLASIRPQTVGQASRISGVTPSDISILMVFLRRAGSSTYTTSEDSVN